MKDTFEFTLNSPLTEEDWDMISDVDFDRTDNITFHTKHGKEVEFTKVIQCKDCKHFAGEGMYCACNIVVQFDHFYCYYAERKEE